MKPSIFATGSSDNTNSTGITPVMPSRMIILAALLSVLASATEGSACRRRHRCYCNQSQAAQPVPGKPHAENARHPQEVERILTLLPEIPAEGAYEDIIEMLGLPTEWDSGSVSSTHCTMVWEHIAPGYKFALNFDPIPTEDGLTLKFTEASFSAQGKPGFPLEQHHTIYPYRDWEGMVHKRKY